MQISKLADIFSKNHLKNVPCANIRNCFWMVVVTELISSHWKVVATLADSYNMDIFFSCKRVQLMSGHTQDVTANRHVRINTHADRK